MVDTKQPIVTPYGDPAGLENLYHHAHIFLILGGPSLKTTNLELLNQRGIVTMAVNNVAAWYRPHLWTYGDPTEKFHDAIFRDPAILKLVPAGSETLSRMHEHIYQKIDDYTKATQDTLLDMPGVFAVRRNSIFDPDTWLTEETVNWGNGKDGMTQRLKPHLVEHFGLNPKANKNAVWNLAEEKKKSGELPNWQWAAWAKYPKVLNTMPQAVRLCYYLGFRHVYLLGCDFTMSDQSKYAFDEDGNPGTVAGNESAYCALTELFSALRPKFEEAGFEVLNCNPGSLFTVFDYISFTGAVARARAGMPDEIDTRGWYAKKH